jgi:hypothetical protein
MTKTSNRDDGNDKTRTSSRERISLEAFVHRKGQVRALEEFKYRKQHKKIETAKALRSYRKVMKQQGYEAGQGASRKRMEEPTSTAENTSTSSTAKDEDHEDAPKEYKKRHKMNPFEKPAKRAEEQKRMAETHKEKKETGEKERQKCLKERKRRTKLLSKRTKRGQPIMKHMMDNLLEKLEKQNQS